MKFLVLVLLAVSCSTTNRATWPLVALGATALDAATTQRAISAGAVEANPILRNRGKVLVINAAICVTLWLLTKDMKEENYNAVWAAVAGLHLGAAAWNWKETTDVAVDRKLVASYTLRREGMDRHSGLLLDRARDLRLAGPRQGER